MGGRGSDKSEKNVQKRARERTCVGLAVATRDITPGAMAALPRPQMIAAVILRPRPGAVVLHLEWTEKGEGL